MSTSTCLVIIWITSLDKLLLITHYMLINFCGDLTNLIEALRLTYLVLFSKHNNRIGLFHHKWLHTPKSNKEHKNIYGSGLIYPTFLLIGKMIFKLERTKKYIYISECCAKQHKTWKTPNRIKDNNNKKIILKKKHKKWSHIIMFTWPSRVQLVWR